MRCPHRFTSLQFCELSGNLREPVDIKDDEDLLQMISSNLKMLSWDYSGSNPELDLPIKSLSNLIALSICSGYIPSRWPLTLKTLSSAAPRLSHLRLYLYESNSHILSEVVEFPSLAYLCVHLGASEPLQAFRGWRFPSLRTLAISGTILVENKTDFESFLRRHANTITELDTHNPSIGTPLSYLLTNASLWNLCPNVHTIAGGAQILRLLQHSQESQHSVLPRLTFLLRGFYTKERFFEEICLLIRGKAKFDIERIIYYQKWQNLRMKEPLDEEWSISFKKLLEECRKGLEEAQFPIVDCDNVPISHAVEEFLLLINCWRPWGLLERRGTGFRFIPLKTL